MALATVRLARLRTSQTSAGRRARPSQRWFLIRRSTARCLGGNCRACNQASPGGRSVGADFRGKRVGEYAAAIA